ncbi:MAG: DUF2244 domain-containing protein [Betaproteobacteria bacterium]|nr:DUF2244 domain-containing protein [Betaproteobacteria bacterium]
MQIAEVDASGYRLICRRNDSLSPRGRRLFFASIVVVSFGIAIAWWFRGAWVVLPFAVIEMAVLYIALRVLESHAGDCEMVSISDDRVVVERYERGRRSRHEFNRYWAQLVVRRLGPGDRCGLALRSHGKEVGFGDYLTDEQRLTVASELRRRLKNY